MNMVALKRVKYPHGPAGREYAPGEPLVALSERDAKALYVSGRAKYGEAANMTDLPKPAVEVAAAKEESVPLDQSYQTRHLEAGPTGAETSPSSSRRGRQPRKQTSDD